MYHFIITMQHRKHWWSRRCVHTVSGGVQLEPGDEPTQQAVYTRLFEAATEKADLDRERTTVVFYRLKPNAI